MKQFLFILSFFLVSSSNAQIITTIAGNGNIGFGGEGGLATNAEFDYPAGVTCDRFGNVYVADYGNNVIQKIDTNGILTRFAGNGLGGYGGDGGLATAAPLQLYVIVGLTTDTDGNIFICCGQRVRKVSTTGIITTVAGNGVYGYAGDGGPATAAEFRAVTGLCFDKAGNLYIADEQSNNIRMVNTGGIISTVAGTTIGYSGDGGPATNAQLKWPHGIVFDDLGNMYIADFVNDRVRKINSAGIISTIAGGDGSGYKVCSGCPAINLQLTGPNGIAVDKDGNVYVAAIGDDAIQKITSGGLAYTIAGNGIEGFSGDGGPATAAKLNNATMICMDRKGDLLITDKSNGRYRKVWTGTTYISPVLITKASLSVYPNPAHQKITCSITSPVNEDATVTVTNILGQVVVRATCTTNTQKELPLQLPPGLYFVTAVTAGKMMMEKVVVD